MNRLLAGAVAAAGALAFGGGVLIAAGSSPVTSTAGRAGTARLAAGQQTAARHSAKARQALRAHHALTAFAGGSGGDNSSYGASAPAGPVTAPPQAIASSTGATSVLAPDVGISGLLTTKTTLDTATTLNASSRVSSPSAAVPGTAAGGNHSVRLTAGKVSSSCRSDTQAASASVSGGVLTVDGTQISHLPRHPAVDQSFPLDGGADGTLTLNHQIPAPGGGVEVQAADLHFTGTSPAQDLLIAVSVCPSPGSLGNTITITSPGHQTSTAGTPIAPLPIVATDSDPGQALTYSASGLPRGLRMDSRTGVISGTPAGPASTHVVDLAVTDATGAAGFASFSWTIQEGS
jgi:hypothetical protein